MKKSAKAKLSGKNKISDVNVVRNIEGLISRFNSDDTSDIGTCFRVPLSKSEAVTILSSFKLPHEGMVMFTRPPGKSFMSEYLEKDETVWYELTREEMGFQNVPDLELEFWMTRTIPFSPGKRRVAIISGTMLKYNYITP